MNRRVVDDCAVGWGTSNLNGMWHPFVERVIQPLIDFLDERVGDQSSVLFVLERYVHMVEWFDRDVLHAAFEADRANGEEVYNRPYCHPGGHDSPGRSP